MSTFTREYRHIHVYAAADYELAEGAERFTVPFVPFKTKSAEENAKREAEHDAKERSRLYDRLDCARVSRLMAMVIDFISTESKTEHAVPPSGGTASLIDVSGKFAGFKFLQAVQADIVSKGEVVEVGRVAFRCKDGIGLRHQIRYEAMLSGRLADSGISPALYFQNPTFSWSSVVGPASAGPTESLVEQLPLKVTKSTRIEQELQTTLQLYSLAGLLPVSYAKF